MFIGNGQARSHPSDNWVGSFSLDVGLFHGLKISSQWLSRGNLDF